MKDKNTIIFKVSMGILALAVIYVIFTNTDRSKYKEERDNLFKENITLKNSLRSSDSLLILLDDVIKDKDRKYLELYNTKNKIKIKYEDRIKQVGDVSAITDDSISSYISSKIHNR